MTDPIVQRHVPLTKAIFDYWVELLMALLPHDSLSNRIKSFLLRRRGASIGKQVKMWRDVWVADPKNLVIGDNVTIGKSAMLISVDKIHIGNRVMIGHGSQLITAGHGIPDEQGKMRTADPVTAPITIADDAWLGASAIILPGVTVGEGAIVAAGAVVTKSVEPFTVVGGVPASVIRHRESAL